MQVDNTRLSSAERLCRLTQRLCLYCGQNGHVIRTCPIRPQRPVVSVVSSSSVNVHPLTTIVQLTTPLHCISVHALLNSGSAGNFISKKRLNVIPYKIQSITGSPPGPTLRGAHSATGRPVTHGKHLSVGSGGIHRWDRPRAPLARFSQSLHLMVIWRSPEVGQ